MQNKGLIILLIEESFGRSLEEINQILDTCTILSESVSFSEKVQRLKERFEEYPKEEDWWLSNLLDELS